MSSGNVVISGASGRVGARLCALCAASPALKLVGAVVSPMSARLGQAATPGEPSGVVMCSAIEALRQQLSVNAVIDFSNEKGAISAANMAISWSAALMVGTTGLSARAMEELRRASAMVPVMVSPNTSLGIAVVARACAEIARALGPSYRASIVESHHEKKIDAPSGTALRLARAVGDGGVEVPPQQIFSVRSGDVIGEHTVRFAGEGEYIEVVHRATTRDLFVRGAMRAARWLIGRAPGWYTMEDMLASPPAQPEIA